MRDGTTSRVAGKWTVLFLGVLAQAIFSWVISGVPVAGILLQHKYDLSSSQIGIMIGCMYLGIAASEIPWGVVVDRKGERFSLSLGLIVTALAVASAVPVLISVDINAYLLFACMLFVGICGGSINGASGRAIVLMFDKKSRGLAMGIRQAAMPLGGALGSGMVPWMVSQMGFPAAFVITALLIFFVFVVVVYWFRLPTKKLMVTVDGIDSAQSPLKSREVWLLSIASCILSFPQFAILAFGVMILVRVAGVSIVIGTSALVMIQLVGGGLRIVFGKLSDRSDSRLKILLMLSFAASLLAFLTYAFISTDSRSGMIVTVTLLGIAANSWHGVAYAMIGAVIPKRAGTALGVVNTLVFLAGFGVPVVVPYIQLAFGWNVVYVLIALFCLVSFIIFLILLRSSYGGVWWCLRR